MCGICLVAALRGTPRVTFPVCMQEGHHEMCTATTRQATTLVTPQHPAVVCLRDAIRSRGPDSEGAVQLMCSPADDAHPPHNPCLTSAVLCSSVLHMRGASCTSQPVEGSCNAGGSAVTLSLAWNGEVFGVEGRALGDENDTTMLLAMFSAALSAEGVTPETYDAAVHSVLQKIEGPYAFVLSVGHSTYFGRDQLGRRSLLYSYHQNHFALSSVAPFVSNGPWMGATFREVPTGGFYRFDRFDENFAITMIEWGSQPLYDARRMAKVIAEIGATPKERYYKALDAAVERRVKLAAAVPTVRGDMEETGSRIGVLYSGGVDCAVLAGLCDAHVPKGESIDLINVAFGDYTQQTPDRVSGRQGWCELMRTHPGRVWNFIEVDISAHEILFNSPHIASLISPADTVMDVNIGSALWFGARGVGRLVPQGEAKEGGAVGPPSLLHAKRSRGETPEHDSAFSYLVSVLKAELVGGRCFISLSDLSKSSALPYKAAGCKRAGEYAALAEKHGFIETKKAAGANNNALLLGLPGASAKEKEIEARVETEKIALVRSSARVLLVGMGADETLGGYSRYRNVFAQDGLDALAEEMQKDFARLWKRNLGRDDRIISDLGREARFPFLDETVLRTLSTLPLPSVTDLSAPQGEGDKHLIRSAANTLGLKLASSLHKRAIQFGTRLANSKVDGTTTITKDNVKESVKLCLNVTALKRPFNA